MIGLGRQFAGRLGGVAFPAMQHLVIAEDHRVARIQPESGHRTVLDHVFQKKAEVLAQTGDPLALVGQHPEIVPVQPQLLVSVVGVGMDAARLMRDAIDAPQFAAL